MTAVPVKSADRQADAMIVGVRDLLVRQRTQLINALRGHAAEFGVIAASGTCQVQALVERVNSAEARVPAAARQMLAVLAGQVAQADGEIAALDARMRQAAKADATARRLMNVPMIGPVGALTLSLTVDPSQFQDGRHFASWLGLVPKDRSTGGKQRLGGISREGSERLRQLLVVGALAVIRHAIAPSRSDCEAAGGGATGGPGSKSAPPWLLRVLERRPRKLAAVALANKMARVMWAMMARGEEWRGLPASVPAAAA